MPRKQEKKGEPSPAELRRSQVELARAARADLLAAHARRARVASAVEADRAARCLQSAFGALSATLRNLVYSQLRTANWRVVTDAQDPGRWRWDPIDGLFYFDYLGLAWLGPAYSGRADHSSWVRTRMQLDPDEDVDREVDRLSQEAASLRVRTDLLEGAVLRAPELGAATAGPATPDLGMTLRLQAAPLELDDLAGDESAADPEGSGA